METGREKTTLSGHKDSVKSISFSPDGKILASGGGGERLGDNTIRLWDIETGREKAKLSGHVDSVLCLAFSPDGKILASGAGEQFDDYTIRLWDTETGKEKAKLSGHTDSVLCLAFSPDGHTLASGSSDKTVRLWDLSFFYEVKDKPLSEEKLKEAEQMYNLKLVNMELQPIPPERNLYGVQPQPPRWPKTHPFHWLSKAESGDAEAMVQLGLCYDRDNENDKALHWYQKAADAGNAYGKERLEFLKKWMEKNNS